MSSTATEPACATEPAAPPSVSGSGLGYMMQAAFWFAMMSLLVKLAGASMPTMQIVFARAIVTLTLSSIGLWRASLHPFGNRTGLLLFRGLVGSAGLVCFYAAVVHLPLAEATVIHQISPILTVLLAALWLGEKLQPRVMLGMALAFGGVVMIAQPTTLFGGAERSDVPWQWVAVAVLGAFMAALAYVTVRRLGRTEAPLLVVFYFPIVTVPLSAPFAIAEWVAPDLAGWALLLGVGVTTQIAQIALTKGLAREPAGRAMAVGYLQIAFATLFGAIVFGALPGIWSWAGMALIVGSLFVATRR